MFNLGRNRYYRILTCGDPSLGRKAVKLEEINEDIRAIAAKMTATMTKADGIGLAAPQVGFGIRLVVLGVPAVKADEGAFLSPGEVALVPRMPLVLVNPEFIPVGVETSVHEEGCLSVPEIYAEVKRPARIILTANSLEGENINIECGGLLGRAVQHEIDHLDGILFIDRLDKERRREIEAKWKKMAALKKR